ncbi:MAG: hypothetical protein WBM24_20085 [Candidatus Sulfotelmatobacter sp.]
MALGPVLDHGPLKLVAGKQLQDLAGNAGYSYHGGGVFPTADYVFSTQTVAGFYRVAQNLFWTTTSCAGGTPPGHENGFPQPGS